MRSSVMGSEDNGDNWAGEGGMAATQKKHGDGWYARVFRGCFCGLSAGFGTSIKNSFISGY